MAENFTVDELNLSFSGDEGENLFIMQSTFRNVSTQEVESAADFFLDMGDIIASDTNDAEKRDLNKLAMEAQSEMCEQIFDFEGDTDNGWSVSTQSNPHIVTRHSDGKQFLVGDEHSQKSQLDANVNVNVQQVKSDEMEADLKRFSTVVSRDELELSKHKWSVWCFSINVLLCVSLIVY